MSPETPRTVTVLAAASLMAPFEAMADDLEADDELRIVYSFGPSSALVEQLAAGAPADVIATADARTMDDAVGNGLIEGWPTLFATNTLVILVPEGNPGDVVGIADLARDDLRVVLCEPQVPCGHAAEQVLKAAGVDAAVDTYATDVAQATALVTLGEVDAALVYRTNAAAVADEAEVIEVPEAADVINEYYVGEVANAGNDAGAELFIAHVSGAAGRDALTTAGFVVP